MSDTLTVSNINYKTLLGQTGSSLSVGSLSMASTVISIGASTNQAYNNFSNGSYTTGWGSTLGTYNVLRTVKKVTMSQSGQYQYALQTQSSASTYPLSFSQNSGITWTTLGGTASSSGLPTGSLAYASTSSGVPAYSNFSQSANGQYALALVNGGLPYVSNNANTATPVFTAANVGAFPYVYLPFDNSVTDLMGNSVVTATGAPSFTTGKVGTNAITFANTAGGTATQYVRGPWTGSANFTISFWFNATSTTSNQYAVSAYGGLFAITVSSTVSFIYPTGGTYGTISSSTITANTWNYVVVVFQTNGTCSLTVNNGPAVTATNTGGPGTTTTFTVGCIDTGVASAFNGSIDDLRIYNSAVPNVVLPYAYLPFEGNTTDAMGNTITATGSPGFVLGIVGSQAVSLNNATTIGLVPSQYITMPFTYSSNFTVSLWFNSQSSPSSNPQIIVGFGNGSSFSGYIGMSSAGLIYAQVYASDSSYQNIIGSTVLSQNTWYNLLFIYQQSGTISLYLNNGLVGTVAGKAFYYPPSSFRLGGYAHAVSGAFNGFIDDLRIYNYANYSPIVPMNYSYSAVSATGLYMMVAASTGGMFLSSNYGASWSAITASQIAGLFTSATAFAPLTTGQVTGQVITPNSVALGNVVATNASWSINGVTWAASASSNLTSASAYPAWAAFNNSVAGTVYSWASVANYNAGSPYAYNSTTSVVISGQTTVYGDWLQLQSSTPVVMSSYTFAGGGGVNNFPQKYWIIGSNDGTTWYPIQYASLTTNPVTSGYQTCTTYILTNQSGTQSIQGGQTGLGTFTAYATTTNAYTYFRILTTNIFGAGTVVELCEWFINFATTPLPLPPLYVSPSASATALTVSPQQTGVAAASWTASGVGWVASSSSNYNTTFPQYLFNTVISAPEWISAGGTYSTAGNTSGYTTTIQGVSSVQGDWVQIQSSIPLVMSSYQFATGYLTTRLPKTYWILGSTDGTTWYPIQYGSGGTVTSTASFTLVPGVIIVATAGAQTFGSSSVTFTTYATTTNAYTYFRLVGLSTYNSSGEYLSISEWFINFTAYTPPLLNALTMSSTGQYLALTGSASVSPNLTGLAASTWTQNGVGWTASQSSGANGGSYTGYYAFNNALTAPDWASRNDGTNSYLGTPGVPTGTCPVTSNVTGLPSGTTVTAEWLQIQSSVPLIMNSYIGSAGGGVVYAPRTYYILGSNDGVNWYNIQSVSINTNPYNTTFTSYSPAIIVNSTGSQSITGQIAAVATTTATSYSANAYTYFRICITSVFSGTIAEIGEWYINFQAGPTYLSTNYGATWTTPLGYVPYSYYANAPAVTLPNANLLAISGNGQYMLEGTNLTVQLITVPALTGYLGGVASTPTFSPALAATVNCASISLTGQYMVVLTQGTTNNVYYSTNYGVTFTGLTIGSSPMTGCAISNDGSYLTVSNATTMYTLNLNAQGYAVSLGNAAGQTNQGSNAIAIGNLAAQTNQSANSIVLNASGSALNAYTPGFFVAPIASYGSSTSASFALLGYGSDNQVVQTSVTVLANGATTLGAYVMPAVTSGTTFGATALVGQFGSGASNYWGSLACNVIYGNTSGGWTQYTARLQRMVDGVSFAYIDFTPYLSTDSNAIAFGYGSATGGKENMRITSGGNVGIGTTAPNSALTVAGNIAPSVTTTYTLGATSYVWGGTYTTSVSNMADTLSFYCAPTNGTAYGYFNFSHNGSTYANLSQGRGPGLQFYAQGDIMGGIYFMSNASSTANTAYAQINVRGFGGGSVTYLYIVPTGPTAVYATVYPGFDQTVSLGVAGYRWSAVYAVNGTIQTSDSKEKDAVPLSYGLNEILQVRTIKYKWKSQADLPDDSPEKNYQYYGFCADELAPIFPELVYNEDPKVPVQMNYSEIMPVMVNAIKEQNVTIVSLQTQVVMLEARLAALESK